MSGVYGDATKVFQISGLDPKRKFYTVVNAKTGVIQLNEIIEKKEGLAGIPIGGEEPVGTLSPNARTLTPFPAYTTGEAIARAFGIGALQVINRPENLLAIRNRGLSAATLGILKSSENNNNAQIALNQARRLIFPNKSFPPAQPQQGGAAAPGATPAPGAAAGTPTTTQGGESPQQEPSTEPDVEQASANPTTSLVIAEKDLRYPSKMKKSQDVIKFQAYQLKERAQLNVPTPDPNNTTPPAGNSDGQQESNPPDNSQAATYFTYTPDSRTEKTEPVPGEKAVYISIQSPISDQNVVDWSPGNMSAVDYALFGLSMRGIEGQLDFIKLAGGLTGEARRYRDRITKFGAGQAASVNNILARTDNVILNPNLELLFNAPQLRSFSFTFKMSAREKEEAKDIKNIIRYFKYHMAVRKEQGLFLKAPHVFKIDYMHKNQENHPGINKIKICALTNFSVDYTPMGTYMTYEDGTMVAYTLNMQFQELVPIYDDDYGEANENATEQKVFHEIGF